MATRNSKGLRAVIKPSIESEQARADLDALGKVLDGLGPAAQEAGRAMAAGLGSVEEAAAKVEEAVKANRTAMRALGLRTEQDVNRQRRKLVEAFEAVQNSGVASAEEIARAQAVLTRRLAKLDEQLAAPVEAVEVEVSRLRRAATATGQALGRAFGQATAGAVRLDRAVASALRGTLALGGRGALAVGRVGLAGGRAAGGLALRGGALGGGLAVAGVASGVGLAASTATSLRELDKAAARAGLSLERFQGLSFAASQLGIEIEDVSSSLQTLTERIGEGAVLGDVTPIESFRELGLSRQDLIAARDPRRGPAPVVYGPDGKPAPGFARADGTLDTQALARANGRLKTANELVNDIARNFNLITDKTARFQALYALFGDDARFVSPLIQRAADDFDRQARAARTTNIQFQAFQSDYAEGVRIGAIASRDQVESAKQASVQFERLKSITAGIARDVGVGLFGPSVDGARELEDVLLRNREVIVSGLVGGLRTLGSTLRETAELAAGVGSALGLTGPRRGPSGGPLFEAEAVLTRIGPRLREVGALFRPGLFGGPPPIVTMATDAIERARTAVEELRVIIADVTARVQAGVVQVQAYWTQIQPTVEQIVAGVERLGAVVAAAGPQIEAVFGVVAALLPGVDNAIQAAALLLTLRVTGLLRVITGLFSAAWGLIGAAAVRQGAVIGAALASGVLAKLGGLAAAAVPAVAGVVAAIGGIPLAVGAALAAAVVATVIYWDDIKAGAAAAYDWVRDKWSGLSGWFSDLFSGIADTMRSAWDSLGDLGQTAVRSVVSSVPVLGPVASFAGGFAGGGPVRGPGTGTSDSIPALLSNGEFVVSARAVNAYGRALFEGLNARRFSTGGFVAPDRRPTMSSMTAAGGSSGSGRPLVLELPGGGSVGARVSDTAAAALVQRLRRSSSARASNKPRWA